MGVVLSSGLVFLFSVVSAGSDTVPTYSVIVKNVLEATSPSFQYTAEIHQILNSNNAASAKSVSPECNYVYNWNPEKGVSTSTAPSTSKSGEKTASDQAIRVSVDIRKQFADIASWKDTTATRDEMNGRVYYKIVSKNGDPKEPVTTEMWVDAQKWFVAKMTIDVADRRFTEATFEYQKVEGFWLPSKADFNYNQGVTVIHQDIGPYQILK